MFAKSGENLYDGQMPVENQHIGAVLLTGSVHFLYRGCHADKLQIGLIAEQMFPTLPHQGSQSGNDKRGFAAMDDDKQREIAGKGGKAAHEGGKAKEFTPEEARKAGRKGGEAVSQDREHMAEIGKKGGEARAENDDNSQGGRGGNQGGSSQRGGSSEQHAKAGSQSHKND